MEPQNPMDPAFDPSPRLAGLDAPTLIEFRVTYNDGSTHLVEAVDEADALAANNPDYTGPAFPVHVTPAGRK